MTSDFKPGDHVRARLWPELGTGTVNTVTRPTSKQSNALRVAEVSWATGQTSRHSFTALAMIEPPAIYYCPTSGEWEQTPGGGFDVCCDAPDRHVPLPPLENRPLHVMSCDECRGDLDTHGHFPDCSGYREEATA